MNQPKAETDPWVPSKETLVQWEREDILSMRQIPLAKRFKLGMELSDLVFQIMRDGVRAQFPGADEIQIQAILRRRAWIRQRLEATS